MKTQEKLIDYLLGLFCLSNSTHDIHLQNFKKDHFVPTMTLSKIRVVFQSTEVYFRAFTLTPSIIPKSVAIIFNNKRFQTLRKIKSFFLKCGLRRFDHLPHLHIPKEELISQKDTPFIQEIMKLEGHCHQLAYSLYEIISKQEDMKGRVTIYHGFIDGYENEEYVKTYKHSFITIKDELGENETIFDPIFSIIFRLQKEPLTARNYCGFPLPISFIERSEEALESGVTTHNFSGYLIQLLEEDNLEELDLLISEIKKQKA